jgi:hypothetical protein
MIESIYLLIAASGVLAMQRWLLRLRAGMVVPALASVVKLTCESHKQSQKYFLVLYVFISVSVMQWS